MSFLLPPLEAFAVALRFRRALLVRLRACITSVRQLASRFDGGADERSSVIRVAFAFVPGLARIGTKRALHGDALGGIVADKFCRDNPVRRSSILHPMGQRGERVMASVGGRRA